MKRQRISNRLWNAITSLDMRKFVSELQDALDSVPEQKIFVTAAQQYTEPMYLATDDERVPRIVTLARVVQADAPTTPVTFGAVCWEYAGGAGGQVKIIDVVSMATGATKYLFTWKVEW